MSGGDFRITIDIKDVTSGDVEGVAQDIWDRHAADLDAKLGDFKIEIGRVQGSTSFLTDWVPAS